MRIGIITFHKSENFGSALQVYALSEIIQSYGHQVDIIDFVFDSDMEQYRLFRTTQYKRNKKSFIADILYLGRNSQRKWRFHKFRNKYMKLTAKTYHLGDSLDELNNQYDGFVCGSDQIWNLNCTKMIVPPFFLSFAQEEKMKIAISPSMPCEIEEKYYCEVKQYVERLDYVSVREKQTVDFLKNKVKVRKIVKHAVDPTLMLPAHNYIKKFSLKSGKGRYIFVYVLGDKDSAKMIASRANELSKQISLPIKYVYNRHIKEIGKAQYYYGIGPIEFLELIYNAEYVITDSFHATVFSILFEKKMCVFPRRGSSSRMEELLCDLGMENRMYRPQIVNWISEELPKDLPKRMEGIITPTKQMMSAIFEHSLND